MADYQNSFEPTYSPYMRFNSPNFWASAAASHFAPATGPQDWIGGALNDPYRTLQDRHSAFQKDQNFMAAMQKSAVIGAPQILPESALGEILAKGGVQVMPSQTQAVANALIQGSTYTLPMWQNATGRAMLDAAGAPNFMNVGSAFAYQMRRGYDPVTGARNMSADSVVNASMGAYNAVFGDVNNPNNSGLYGYGAADMNPMMNFMSRHGRMDSGLERRLLTNDFMTGMAQASTMEERNRYRAMMSGAGMEEGSIDQLMSGQVTDMDKFKQESFGGRTGKQMKSLANMVNAIREMTGPDVVKTVNDALVVMEQLTSGSMSQFSDDRAAQTVRRAMNSLSSHGMGYKEIAAYAAYSDQTASNMGYQGAMGFTNIGYMAAQTDAFHMSGFGKAVGYGRWNQSQTVQEQGQQRLAYGKSQDAKMVAAMMFHAQSNSNEFKDTALGKKMAGIVKGIEIGTGGGQEWESMTMEDRMAMYTEAARDPNAGTFILEVMGNDAVTEGELASKPSIMNSVERRKRREMETRVQDMARAGAMKQGFGVEIADTMASSLFALELTEASSSNTATDAMARRTLDSLSESERLKYGATQDEQLRNLKRISSEVYKTTLQEFKGTNLANILSSVGDTALDAQDQSMDYANVNTLLDEVTANIGTTGAADAVKKGIVAARGQLKRGEQLNITGIMQSALTSLGEGDVEGRKQVTEALGKISERKDALANRLFELQATGEEGGREGQSIQRQLTQIEKFTQDLDKEMETRMSDAEKKNAEEKEAAKGTSDPKQNGSAVFNNLTMVLPNNMTVTVGDVVATPPGASAVT